MTAPNEWASQWLRNALNFSGITAAELSRRMNYRNGGPCYISKVLHGRIQPKTSQIVKLIEACGLEIIELRVKKKAQ